MDNSMKELNMEELEQVSGGIVPIIIGGIILGGVIGYGVYRGVKKRMEQEWF